MTYELPPSPKGWQLLDDLALAGVELTDEQRAQVMRFYEVQPQSPR